MQRDLYQKLLEWKEKPDRKPLVVKGARQVGKTYLIKDFGNHEFDNFVVLNADKSIEDLHQDVIKVITERFGVA